MLRRQLPRLNRLLGALIPVVLAGGLGVGTLRWWVGRRLQPALAREMSQLLGREVAVGPVTGDPLTGIRIDGVAVAEGQRLSGGAVLTADRVEVLYDLPSALRRGLSAAAAIRRIDLHRPHLLLTQDPRGELNIQDILPKLKPVPPEKRFRGRVYIHDGFVVFRSAAPYVRRGTLDVRVGKVDGSVDCAAAPVMRARLEGRLASPGAQTLALEATTEPTTGLLALKTEIGGLDLAWANRAFNPASDPEVLRGRAKVRGHVFVVRRGGKPTVDFGAWAQVESLTARAKPLGSEPATLSGAVWAGMDGVRIEQGRLQWAGTELDVAGTMAQYDDPLLDVSVFLEKLPRMYPPAVTAALEKSAIADVKLGGLRLDATVLGPHEDPDVRLTAHLAGGSEVRTRRFGVFRARGADLQAHLVGPASAGLAAAKVRLTVDGLRAPAQRLPPAGTNPSWPHVVTARPALAPRAELQLEGAGPSGTATIEAPELLLDDLSVTGVKATLRWHDDLVRVDRLQARALGGEVRAKAVGREVFGKEAFWQVDGTLEGADLRTLSQLPLATPADLTGSANATFHGQYSARQGPWLTARVLASDVEVEQAHVAYAEAEVGLSLDGRARGVGLVRGYGMSRGGWRGLEGQALVTGDGSLLYVHGGYAKGPAGTAWVRGTVDLEKRVGDLRVQAAEVDVPQAAAEAGLENVGGKAYFRGTVTGTPEQPAVAGRLTVFDPSYRDHTLNALTADVAYLDDDVRIRDAYANLGSGVVHVYNAQVSDVSTRRGEAPVSGTVAAQGLDLARLARAFGEDWPVAGQGEVEARVSGTVNSLVAAGLVHLVRARYDDFLVDELTADLTADSDGVSVRSGDARAHGAEVGFSGDIAFAEPNTVHAKLSVQGLRLQGIPYFWEIGLPVEGEVSIENASAGGPLKELRGAATLRASDVKVGQETLEELVATAELSGGQVTLKDTEIAAAGGTFTLSGSLDYASEDRGVNARADFTGVDISDVLSLAQPLVRSSEVRHGDDTPRLARRLQSWALRTKTKTEAGPEGGLEGSLIARGPISRPEIRAQVSADVLTLDDETFRSEAVTEDGKPLPALSGRATVTGRRWENISLALRQGRAQVTVDGNIDLDGPLNADIGGSGIEISQLRPWLPFDLSLSGGMGFALAASGTAQRPELRGSVDIEKPVFAGVGFDVLSTMVELKEGSLSVEDLIVKRKEQELHFAGTLPFSWETPLPGGDGRRTGPGFPRTGAVDFSAKAAQIALGFFPPLIDEFIQGSMSWANREPPKVRWSAFDVEGVVDSEVKVTGTMEAPLVGGNLKLSAGVVKPPKWQTPFAPVQLDLAFTGQGDENRVDLRQFSVGYDDTLTSLTGAIQAARGGVAELARNRYDLSLQASSPSQALPGGSALKDFAGGLTFKTGASGRHRLEMGPTEAQLGGGRVMLSGSAELERLDLRGLAQNDFDLKLELKAPRLKYGKKADAAVNGTIALAKPKGGRATLSGNLAISDGVFGLLIPAKGASRPLYGAPAAWPDPELAVTVAVKDRVVIRGAGLSLPVEPRPEAAVLTGTPQLPTLRGSLWAREGSTSLPTGRVTVEKLAVDYALTPVTGLTLDPRPLAMSGAIEGRAYTTIPRLPTGAEFGGETKVTAEISGNLPDDIKITAQSDPPLTNAQILALLGGLPQSFLSASGLAEEDLGRLLSDQFLSSLAQGVRLQVFAPFEDELKRLFGLSELGVSFAFDQPVLLKVGKYLLENFLVTYERTIGVEPSSFRVDVSYKLPSGVRLNYHVDEREGQRLRVGVNREF